VGVFFKTVVAVLVVPVDILLVVVILLDAVVLGLEVAGLSLSSFFTVEDGFIRLELIIYFEINKILSIKNMI
jgi:hypothetical protein